MLETIVQITFITIAALIVRNVYMDSILSYDKKYKTFWPRFWALVVDGFILIPFSILIPLILKLDISTPISLSLYLMTLVFPLIYDVYMHGRYGQTLGKMVCKVQILKNGNEKPISFKKAIVRSGPTILSILLFIALQGHVFLTTPTRIKDIYDSRYLANNSNNYCYLLLFPMVWFAIELLTMLSNKKRRALHDYIADTVVIRTNIQKEEKTKTLVNA